MKLAINTAAVLLAAAVPALGQWSDDFNRPDGPIGPDWTPTVGTFAVQGNRGRSTGTGNQWMRHNTASAAYDSAPVSVDVYTEGTALQYVAIATGVGGSDNLYIKVQGSGSFAQYGMYHGFNGLGWGGAGAGFFTLSAPFTDARITVSIENAGDTVRLDIDTDFNGTPDQTYTASGVSVIAPNFGNGYSIGTFGVSVFDNWVVGTPVAPCYPDCNGDDVLNLADFGCFQTKFALGDPYADCNGDSVLNLADFGCFQTKFALGCP